jgi:hypothetical protein
VGYRRIHVLPIAIDIFDRRTRKQAPGGPGVRSAVSFIIRIEEMIVGRVKEPVTFGKRLQDKRFEKPRDMRNVPLWRAYIIHALNHVIFVCKWATYLFCHFANPPELLEVRQGRFRGKRRFIVTEYSRLGYRHYGLLVQ